MTKASGDLDICQHKNLHQKHTKNMSFPGLEHPLELLDFDSVQRFAAAQQPKKRRFFPPATIQIIQFYMCF